MQRQEMFNWAFVENLLWFGASLLLAFLVWVLASTQSDPIQERLIRQIAIQIEPDSGLLVVNRPTTIARVSIRAQQSVLNLLTADDIVVRADLTGKGPGTHVVELKTQVNRRAVIVDTLPTQITVILEPIEARKVPVVSVITRPPQVEYEWEQPVFDQNQVEVGGAASKVAQVMGAQAVLDLSQQRNPFETDVRLVPVNANGETVDDVTIDPQTVHVSVVIRQRNDVRQIPVRPNILFDTLPQGYFLSSISYDPQTIVLSGDLTNVPNILFTAPIDLTNRVADFEISVPVELPESDVQVLGTQNIMIFVGITAPTANRQFDDIPVSQIGLSDDFTARLTPSEVTVLVTGPQPILESLTRRDLQVIIDLNGLGAGNHEVIPAVSVRQSAVDDENLSVLPASIDVEIIPLPEATAPPAG